MSFDKIWAPWRLPYITGQKETAQSEPRPANWLDRAEPECFICRAVAESAAAEGDEADRANHVVANDEVTVTLLNKYPYTNGHLLVAPRRHVAELSALTDEEHLGLMRCLSHAIDLFREQMKAEGFNIGLNLGRVAGAGLPGHLHWHIVPRWGGDTNFMTSLASVRVIPQSLDALWEFLRHEW